MTPPEFEQWLAIYDATFPSYADKRKARSDRHEVEASMMGLMSDVSLRHARMATQSACKGEIAGITAMTPWDKYPQLIRAKARELSSAANAVGGGPKRRPIGPDGEPTFRCPKCQDSGWREVVDGMSLKEARDFDRWMESGLVRCGLAACSCEAGQKFMTWKNPPNAYDDIRPRIDYPDILNRPRTPIAWRNWMLDRIRESHEWRPDEQRTSYDF